MLAWWAIVSGLSTARPRVVEIPKFLELRRPPPPSRWPCFLASLALHLAAFLLLPLFSDLLAAGRSATLVRRYRLLAPVEIRVPERLYLASAGPKPPQAVRVRRASAVRRAVPGGPGRDAQGGAAQAGGRRLRRFELPRLRVRKSDQTLLQPGFPPDLPVLSQITLPQVFFWAPLPADPALRIRKPFVTPGSAEPFAQPPRLDAPPQLTTPNWEATTLALQVASTMEGRLNALLAPGISLPVRLPDAQGPPPETHVSVDRSVGDPLSVLALNWRLRPLREQLLVPPGNQLAEIFGEGAGMEVAGSSGTRAAAHGEGAGGSAQGAGAASANAAARAPGPAASAATEAAEFWPAAQPSGAAAADARNHSTAAAATGAERQQTAASQPDARAQGYPTASARQPAALWDPSADGRTAAARDRAESPPAAVRIDHPPSGVFDVVVVQPAPIEGFPESSGALSGRPVYSVFLRVGAPKEWILQYCVPGEDQSLVVSGGLVRLGNPSPVSAPYPRVTYLPVLRRRPGSYMMVHGFLDAAGRFQQLQALRAADRHEAESVIPVLEQWEFRPATRGGRPIGVEILLAIPR